MKNLFVGQRVRIIADFDAHLYPKEPPCVGFEGTISGSHGTYIVDNEPYIGWEVMTNHPGGELYCKTDELEPILYDGDKAIDWSECLWQPEENPVTIGDHE